MYLRYNEENQVDIKSKKKKPSKLELILGISFSLYVANYMNEHSEYIEQHIPELILGCIGLFIFNRLIERLRQWISR